MSKTLREVREENGIDVDACDEARESHYFANHALGWSCGATREEAIEKLLLASHITDPKWVRNCLKDGGFVTVYSCKVHTPIDENYRIEWYVPKGVETSEGRNDLVTYLTAKKFAIAHDPSDEVFVLKQQLKDREQLLRNLAYSVATSESIHDDNIVKYLAEAKEFVVAPDA